MRLSYLTALLCLIITSLPFQDFGQRQELISGEFKNMSFAQFAAQMEKSYPLKFYFDSSETVTVKINITADNFTINQLLTKILDSTALKFSIDPANRIFITKRAIIQTKLPEDFFIMDVQDSVKTSNSIITEDNMQNQDSDVPDNAIIVGSISKVFSPGNATITGYVRENKTGEAIIGASVYVDTPSVAVNTDQFGYFSITLPKGNRTLHIIGTGMKETEKRIALYGDGKLDISLQEYVSSLKAVTVFSERTSNLRNLKMGVASLNIKTIKQIPVAFGEADISKVILALPGVTSVGEASNGFNVRGGSTDQNLILFGDATIYNPSHLFGFFSSFNPDMVKGIELYKSAIPEKFGGRLSSVLDVAVREGNNKKVSGSAGIGPLTSKVLIEGPLKKEKSSFIASVRSSYSDWILRLIPDNAYSNSSANFYDASLHVSHTLNSKNSVYLTGYASSDRFRLNNDTVYKYSNKNLHIKWKHIFNNKLYNVTGAGIDHYEYNVSSDKNNINAFRLGFRITQLNFRSDFSYSASSKHTLNFGLTSTWYKLHPGSFSPLGTESLVSQNDVAPEQALETALYLGDQYTISDKLSASFGIRYSVFNNFGPASVNYYAPGIPKDSNTIVKTTSYSSGSIIKTYHAPEVRLAIRYILSNDASLKLSYNTLRQYIHMLSNTTAISPTDIWKLSDANIQPQRGNQISVGIYKNFKANTIETSVEVYYKQTRDYLDYRSGANLVLNHHIETDVMGTKGKAYGAEFLIKKRGGKLNGWLSYTFSRTFLKADDATAGEIINKGNYYPASFDKPHNVNLITNYQFSHRYSMSLNFVYNTGRPITLPLAIFNTGGTTALFYSDRNAYRIPDYFRMDISINIEGNHKVKQLTHNSWSFGAYNLTGRQNPYSVYFIQQEGKIKGYKLSIFGSIIPFATYNIKF